MMSFLSDLTAILVMTAAGPAAAHVGQTAPHPPAHNHAVQNQAAQLKVTHAWIRVLPGALPGAGYAVIRNHGDTPAVIVAARSRAYGSVMLHKSRVSNGVSQMVAVPKLTIQAHGRVRLQPGGYHLMMMHAMRPVQAGHTVPVTLELADGSTLDVRFTARPANATGDKPAGSAANTSHERPEKILSVGHS